MSNDKKGSDPKKSADDLKKQIIGSIQGPYTGEQTSRWIMNMNDESLVTQIASASESTSLLDVNVVKLTDMIFDDFQRYIFEYQKTPAGTRFILNCLRPTVSDAGLPNQYGQVPVLCQGHLSTAHWVMIVQGRVGKISTFIVPVEFLVGFKAAQNQFTPFLEAKAVQVRGKTDWKIDDHSISKEMLPIISKRIFGALIKVEHGEASETDKFFFDPSMKDDEPTFEVESMPERETEPELLSESTGPSQQRTWAQQQDMPVYQQQPGYVQQYSSAQHVPVQQQNSSQPVPAQQSQPMYQDQQAPSQQMPAYQQQSSSQQAPVYQPQPSSPSNPVSQQPQSAVRQMPAYPQPQQQQNQPQQQPQQQAPAPVSGYPPQNAQQQSGQHQPTAYPQAGNFPALTPSQNPDLNAAFERNNLVVQSALEELVSKLDGELESLTRVGMNAIQSQDMNSAQITINRATRLKDIRQRVNDLTNEWRSIISGR